MAWWVFGGLRDDEREALFTIRALLVGLVQQEGQQVAAIDDLRGEVSENTTVVGSAVTLLGGLKARIDELIAAGNHDPALAQLSAELGANNDALAAAVAQNTPSA